MNVRLPAGVLYVVDACVHGYISTIFRFGIVCRGVLVFLTGYAVGFLRSERRVVVGRPHSFFSSHLFAHLAFYN